MRTKKKRGGESKHSREGDEKKPKRLEEKKRTFVPLFLLKETKDVKEKKKVTNRWKKN